MAKQFRPILLLPIANLVAAVVTCLVVLANRGWATDYKAIARCLDLIARGSFVWLIPTYAARPLNDLLHKPWTRWLVKQRRYLGLSFAAWFLQHLWLLPILLVSILGNFWGQGRLIFPLVTLLLATFLAITSFDRAQRSMPGWRIVHWIGMQMLLVWFFCIYVRFYFTLRHELYQLVYVILIVACFALRAGGWLRRARRTKRTGSPIAVVVVGLGVAVVLTSVTLVSFFDGQKRVFENFVQLGALVAIAAGIVAWQLTARAAESPVR